MVCVDHHRQRPDADPLQARDHHLRLCRLQYLAVRAVLDHRPGRSVFRRRDPAQPLRRPYPCRDRETPRAVGGGSRCRSRARICRRISNVRTAAKSFALRWLEVPLAIMLDRPGIIAQSTRQVAAAHAALAMLMIAAGAAWPQAAAPPQTSLGVQAPAQQSVPPQTEPAPPPAGGEKPGLFNEIGKMFGRPPRLKRSPQTLEDLYTRAKDAGTGWSDSP